MKIEAKDIKVKSIFSRKVFTIPDYQREYSWTVAEEISLFWSDFLYFFCGDEENFFIGPMVLRGENINAEAFDVIDGQQRMVTIVILLSVIRDFFNIYTEESLKKGLQQYLIYKDERDEDRITLINEQPHPFFQKRILHAEKNAKPLKDDERLIDKAQKFFIEKITLLLNDVKSKKEKISILESLREKIFDIDSVFIVSNTEEDAYTIFETINTRGKNLSSLDLLKNYITKNYNKKTGVREPTERWKKIINNIQKDRENFFNRFWASWIKKESEAKLYRRFSAYMKSNENIFKKNEQLLKEIEIASEIYREIIDPKLDDWKKNKQFENYYSLINIRSLFNLKVHIPFFIALFEEYFNNNIDYNLFRKSLLFIEQFHFIFTYLFSFRASGLDSKYSKFAARLRSEENKKKVIEELFSSLKDKLPPKREFVEKFKMLNYSDHKNAIKYVLLRLEKTKTTSINIELETNSIEHLEPKSSKLNRANYIGNLFLLEEVINNEKDDKRPFDRWPKDANKTVREYIVENTKYRTTKDYIKSVGVWTENEIEERSSKLADEIYNMFYNFNL